MNNKLFDARYLITAGYLANKISGKILLDINCGMARLNLYLPQTYKLYFANDINYEPKYPNPKFYFLKQNDQQIIETVSKIKIDILCLFGHGGGDKLNNAHESKTLTQSAIEIIKQHNPEYIILEAYYEYFEKHRILDNIIHYAGQENKYLIEQIIDVKPTLETNPLTHRTVVILNRA